MFKSSTSCLHFAVAGALHSDPEALRLARAIAETDGMELTGVYAHCGNTYHCRGVEQIQAVAQETTSLTLQFTEKYDTKCKISRVEAKRVTFNLPQTMMKYISLGTLLKLISLVVNTVKICIRVTEL